MFAKTVVVFVITLFTLIKCKEVPDHFEEMALELRKVCMEESGVSVENLDLVMKGQFSDDRALKCYFKCQFETYHLVSRTYFCLKTNRLIYSHNASINEHLQFSATNALH